MGELGVCLEGHGLSGPGVPGAWPELSRGVARGVASGGCGELGQGLFLAAGSGAWFLAPTSGWGRWGKQGAQLGWPHPEVVLQGKQRAEAAR